MTVLLFPTRRERPPVGGLSDSDCFAIAAASRCLPGRWLAQRDEDALGQATMTLIPVQGDGEAPALIIRREGEELQVVLGHLSGLTKLGCCRLAEEAMSLAGAALSAQV